MILFDILDENWKKNNEEFGSEMRDVWTISLIDSDFTPEYISDEDVILKYLLIFYWFFCFTNLYDLYFFSFLYVLAS